MGKTILPNGGKKKRLALVGAKGMLATMVRRQTPETYEVISLDLPDFDITDPNRVVETMNRIAPDVIVNCAAYTDVDACETNEDTAMAVNGLAPGYLADAAARTGALLVHISTDYIFSGESQTPYTEKDEPCPISAYGRSKLAGERAIIESGLTHYFIIRTSWLYGPNGKNFVESILRLAREREELRVVADQVGSPTFTADMARAVFQIIEAQNRSSSYGIYHFSNQGTCSWYEFASAIVSEASAMGTGLKVAKVIPITTAEYPLPARRPAYSVLSSEKFRRLTNQSIPAWVDGLRRYLKLRTEQREA